MLTRCTTVGQKAQDVHGRLGQSRDQALLAGDLAAVVPLTCLTADNKEAFKLILLDQSGGLSMLNEDDWYGNNTWTQLQPGLLFPVPRLKRLAYWINMLFGIDDQGSSWEVEVSVASKSYTARSRVVLAEPVSDRTANDRGPVVAREDDFLCQRYVAESPRTNTTRPRA